MTKQKNLDVSDVQENEQVRVAGDRAILNRIEEVLAARKPVALYLDIDGTLLDMALTPTTVRVPPDLASLLEKLSERLSGALAVVTGRRIAEADELLTPLKFTAAGVHGAEMRLAPEAKTQSLSPTFSPALKREIKAVVEALPGVVLEDKGGGVALHYRLAPELHSSLLISLRALAPKHPGQFAICEGRMVIELLPVGFSKGRALERLSVLPAFENRIPIMIGDDIADADAFEIARAQGGFGLKVAGENFALSEATFTGPSDVLAWLDGLSHRL
ncbi:trehalose-phosphatase [Hyphomicrobium methylovorum]|nr:trehalose-phosphatase [Hyphomicrobium methylovorum]